MRAVSLVRLRWSLNLLSYSVKSQVHLLYLDISYDSANADCIYDRLATFMTYNRFPDYSNCNSNSLDRNLSVKNS